MRVRIRLRRQAVRRPTRMGDAERVFPTFGLRQRLCEESVQRGDFPRLLEDAQVIRRLKGDASRVVASVLKAAKSVDKRPTRTRTVACKSDDSAHVSPPLTYFFFSNFFCFNAAATNPLNSGCGSVGRDLNSGWNCPAIK